MEIFELTGSVRTDLGKKANKALRANAEVPCVIYGAGENVNFCVTEKSLQKLLYTPKVYLVNITIDGKSYMTAMREIQFHPVTDKVLHIDFYQVTETKPVIMEVPVKLVGFAAGVKLGGKLIQVMRKLKVRAIPANLPDELVVDVTPLELGKSMKVKELSFENFEIVNSPEVVVANVKITRDARAAAAAAAKK